MIELRTTKQAAHYLFVSEPTIKRWCQTGKLVAIKVGRTWGIVTVHGGYLQYRSTSLSYRARRSTYLAVRLGGRTEL